MSWTLLAGSLLAVVGLAAIARWLGLGGAAIADAGEACAIAEEAVAGFTARSAIVDPERGTALVEGDDGSAVALKVTGARIAARHLAVPVRRTGADGTILVDTGDRWFGTLVVRCERPLAEQLTGV